MQHTFTFNHIWFKVTIKNRKVTAFEEHDHYAGGSLMIPKDVVAEHWAYSMIANRIKDADALVSVQQFLTLHTDNGWRPKSEYRQLVNEYEGKPYSLSIANTTVIARARALMCELIVDDFFESKLNTLSTEEIVSELLIMHNTGSISVEVVGETTFNDIVNQVLPCIKEDNDD